MSDLGVSTVSTPRAAPLQEGTTRDHLAQSLRHAEAEVDLLQRQSADAQAVLEQRLGAGPASAEPSYEDALQAWSDDVTVLQQHVASLRRQLAMAQRKLADLQYLVGSLSGAAAAPPA